MKPERWQQLDQLFHSALRREPAERPAFLDEACVDDESLRKQVESLLAAHDEAGSFIEKPALEVEALSLANDQGESAVGQTIGHYKILSSLGVGGMGEVYLAEDSSLGRKIALKLLPAAFTRDTDRVHRFQQEARAASGLNHPNIITIYEIGQIDDRHFIATEFIDGQTLRQQTRGSQSPVGSHTSETHLKLDEILSVAIQTADALSAAHEAGIMHRDIKPENIMVRRRDSYVKVLDFGLAKLTEGPPIVQRPESPTRIQIKTSAGVVMGTANYMSPEQARGEVVDVRTDIWSLGVVLYELVAGCAPFERSTPSEVIALILEREPPPLARYAREVPPELERIVGKALTKDRGQRYQTAKDLLIDLRRLRHRLEVEAETERSALPETPSEPAVTEGPPTEVITDESAEPTAAEVARQTSSAEYLVSEIKRHKTGALVALVALVIAVAVTAFGLYKFIGQSRPGAKPIAAFQTMKITRLTSTGKATAAAISPDGKYVVHVVYDGNQQSLWIRQVLTSSNVQINPPADVIYFGLTFSPGGDYLYYCLWDKKTPYALYEMNVLGGAARKLITDIDSIVTFSPDGRQFAFLRGYPTNGVMAVLVANADGTSERKLTTRKLVLGPFGDPAWSPDGKIIAYPAENTDGNGDFMTLLEIRVADGSEKALSSRRWWRVGRIAWLRDGSGIVFAANEDVAGPSQIWYLSYPGGEVHRITNDLNDYEDITLTADSSALVTIQSEQVSNIWTAPNENTSRANQITSSKFDGLTSISWTPDGKIVYDSAASGHLDLWMIEANGRGEKQLTADAGNNSWPSVSPDGRYVVFVSDRTGTNHVWRMDADGSNPTQLTNGGGESFPQCSPIGRWVVFNSRSTGTPLLKVPIDGGEPVPIAEKNSDLVAISPDGKWVASLHFENAKTNTAIYPFEGGEPHQIMDINSYYFRWTPDGRSLAYVDFRNPSAIIIQSIDGGPPRQLADFKPDLISSFAWSRDGKQLAVARGPVNSDVSLIRNFIDQR